MLKILIKKQFLECFKGYFINSKTGKAKSKKSIIGMFVLFAFIMLFLASAFFGMASTLVPILESEFSWLYYAIFGLMTIGLGTFASVFNTSSSLYNAKDNELLLSMPIKPQYILISRVILVYGLSLLYSSVVWLPICIYAFLILGFNLLTCIFDILLLFIITIFTSSLACLLGYVIANITRKVKNKSITTVVLSLTFLGVYYYICFRLENIINSIVENSEKVAGVISTWGYYIYQLALGASGKILPFIIYTVITAIIGTICYLVLQRSYTKIIISSKNVSASTGKVKYTSNNSVSKTLLKKEAKRFVGTPIYLMNCGIGSVMVIAAAVIFFVKRNDINNFVEGISTFVPNVYDFVPLIIICIVGLISAIGVLAVPSVSLEGRNLWILKSLPIDTYKILEAKKQLEFLVNGIPAVIAGIIIGIAFKLDYILIMDVCVVILVLMEVKACIDTLLSLVNPNFTWTSETQPVKQSMMILVAMAAGIVLIIVSLLPYYFLRNVVSVTMYLEYLIIALVIITVLLRKLMRTWAVKKFESL